MRAEALSVFRTILQGNPWGLFFCLFCAALILMSPVVYCVILPRMLRFLEPEDY